MKRLVHRAAVAFAGFAGLALILMVPVGPSSPPIAHAAGPDGSAANCENLVDDFLGFIDIPQPGWVYVDTGQKFNEVTGKVGKAHMTETDFPTVHDSHDFNADIEPDPTFEDILSTGNTDGELEVEWEIGTNPDETGSDPERTYPKWAWPNTGDRAWFNGAWIFDCGHPQDISGTDHFKSEIHPARAVAAMRDQVRPIPGTGTTPVRVTATDLYIHGQSGFVTEDLECGQDVILDIFGGCAQDEPHRGFPIDVDYEFTICTPPKPADTAVLATTFEDGPGNNIGVAPTLTVEPAAGPCVAPEFGPSQVKVEIPLAGTGVTPQQVYARRIFAGWIHPYDGLKHLSVTLNKGDLHDDMDLDPGDCECTFFWISNNRASDEWHRLTAFEIPTDDDAGALCFDHTNVLNDWDDDGGCGNGELNFSGPTYDFYLTEGMDYTLKFRGYDQDCLDDVFGNHNLITSGVLMLDCYAGTGLFTLEPGDNDAYANGVRTLNGTETGGFSIGNSDGDYDFFFNATDIPLTVEDSADLQVTKICKPDDVAFAGQLITCTVLVFNPGPGLPRDVVVDDTLLTNVLPAGYVLQQPTFVFQGFLGAPTDCDAPVEIPGGKHFICNLGTVPVGGSAIITAKITSSEGGDFNNRALVTSASTDPDTTNNEGIDGLTVVPVADVSVTKTIAPGVNPVTAGTGFSYSIQARNDGPSTATNVVVTDVVPAGMAVVSATVPGGSCQAGVPGNPLQPTRCTLGSMAPAATRTISLSVLVAHDTLGQVNNDAAISSDTVDLDNSDNVATNALTVIDVANVSVSKSASPSPNVVAGTGLSYTLMVNNAGPSLARNVIVTDTLPAGVTFTSFSTPAGVLCSILAPLPGGIVCTMGNMAPGASLSVHVNVMVQSATTGSLSNSAQVTTTATDPVPGNNTSAAVVTTVLTSADLGIVKTSDKDVYKPSSQVKYTITVTNNGPSDALSVVVTDNLPDVKQAIYNFDTAGCTKAGLVLTCNLGMIPAGTSKSFNLYVTVKGSKGQITNVASVSSATTDPVGGNNTSTRIVLIGK